MTGKQNKTVVPADIKAKLNSFNFGFMNSNNLVALSA